MEQDKPVGQVETVVEIANIRVSNGVVVIGASRGG